MPCRCSTCSPTRSSRCFPRRIISPCRTARRMGADARRALAPRCEREPRFPPLTTPRLGRDNRRPALSIAGARAAPWPGQRLFEHARRDFLRVEMLLGQRACQTCMPPVIGLDGRERAHRIVERAEAKETLGFGQDPARPGVLDDGRLSAGEIAEGPVADPSVREMDAGGIRAAELAPRLLDVAPVLPRGRGHLPRFADVREGSWANFRNATRLSLLIVSLRNLIFPPHQWATVV